ncbi:hypothetical protein [Hylemonella gracilis]|uniref:AsmA family protein n=1 Tax=Hylemonella gracilis ATCC 19624 TaxID=887062 RepID=F3KST7_9BURK|nr:hypothetical protein [Hylemonella gracilis]EGI77156.1 hypothetical protein HGR_07581 [Hylemonella gracilis ATCC 19624]
MSMPRWTRVVAGVLLALVVAAVAVLAMAALLLRQLDHPWIKPRIVAAVEAASGLRVDYQRASASLTSGLRLEQLVVYTPAPFNGVAPELLRVGRLEADWSLRSLALGPARVARVAVHDLSLTWVADEAGANSLSALTSEPSEPHANNDDASSGASRQLANIFSALAPVAQLEVTGVVLEHVRVRGGAVVDRWSLRGLALVARALQQKNPEGAAEVPASGWALQAEMGRPDAPLALTLSRTVPSQGASPKHENTALAGQGPAVAELMLSWGIQADAAGAQTQIGVAVTRQNFDARIPAAVPLLSGAASAKVDASRRGLDIELHPTRLADSAEAQAQLFLPDDAQASLVLSQARVDADLARLLRLIPADLRPLTLERGMLHLELAGLTLEPGNPQPSVLRSPARLRLNVQADAAQAQLEADKAGDTVSWKAAIHAPDLALVRPFVSPAVLARLPWQRMGVDLSSQGRAEALLSSAPRITQRTELRVRQPAWDPVVSAREVVAVLDSRGDAWRHQGELHLEAEGLRVHEQDAGAQRYTLAFDVNRPSSAPKDQTFEARVRLSSQAGVRLALEAALAFDPRARALRGSVKANLPAQPVPAALQAWLPAQLDAERLALDVDAQGVLTGVITGVGDDGLPQFAPDPLASAALNGQAMIEARGIDWQQDGLMVQVPALRWHLVSHAAPAALAPAQARRTLTGTLTMERARVTLAERGLILTGLSASTGASFGAQLGDEPEFSLQLKIDALEQQPALPYAVRGLVWQLRARRDAEGAFLLPEFKLTHAATRTSLAAQGRLDLAPGRRRFALQGAVSQDVAGLNLPGVMEGRGRASVDFELASPDLATFRTQASLRLDGVNLSLPAQGIVVEGLDGDIPVYEDLHVAQGRVRLLDTLAFNPYAMLRFTDQSPLLSRGGYVSAVSITTPLVRIAPLAGNLTVRQNVFAMSQLEMGVRGGRVTGQSRLDWRGRDSLLELRVRATGLRSSRGEPFDGHAAVVIAARDRSVNGRAEILRIGNRHLLDLLDLADPRATDPAINQVRLALGLGYPDHVRLRFDQGFGRLLVKLGGGAELVRIDEVRGIPLGPLVDRALHAMQISTD